MKMHHNVIAFIVLSLFSVSAQGEEELWSEGKITPEQPFKAEVIGVKPGWGWDTIILKEVGGTGRYCLATFGNLLGTYAIVEPDKFDRDRMIELGATFLTPPVEVERFSWSMGVWKHGKIFGVEDAATKSYKKMENRVPGSD